MNFEEKIIERLKRIEREVERLRVWERPAGGSGVTDHGALTGLADDDHPQYVKDAGTVTDNAIVRYNGTDGRTIQNSGATIDDNNNLSTAGTLIANRGTDGEIVVGSNLVSLIELGKVGRTAAGAAYIDFHSSAGSPDYDTRILSTGGTTTAGQGTLNYYAANHRFDNDIYYKSAVLGGWQTYTPTWTAATTNPVLGNGTLTGRYTKIGKTIIAQIYLYIGSTTTLGSGTYNFSIPVAQNTTYINFLNGDWNINDTGANNFAGGVRHGGVDKILLPYTGAPFYVGSAYPMTWATGDSLRIHFIYESAT